jgi:hypothetical protein
MKILTIVLTAIATLSFASGALAHGGHGIDAIAGFAHWLIEPLHGIPVLASLTVMVIVIRAVLGKMR